MSRKPKKGYFVRGQFIAEGSELDLEYKRELKGGFDGPSRTELKRESTELQDLGTDLLTLRKDLMEGLALPEKLADTLLRSREHTQELEAKRHKTLATTHVPKPSETAVAAKPAKAARVVHPSLICKATCLNGSQCKHRSTRGNYCSKHAPEQNVDTV